MKMIKYEERRKKWKRLGMQREGEGKRQTGEENFTNSTSDYRSYLIGPSVRPTIHS